MGPQVVTGQGVVPAAGEYTYTHPRGVRVSERSVALLTACSRTCRCLTLSPPYPTVIGHGVFAHHNFFLVGTLEDWPESARRRTAKRSSQAGLLTSTKMIKLSVDAGGKSGDPPPGTCHR